MFHRPGILFVIQVSRLSVLIFSFSGFSSISVFARGGIHIPDYGTLRIIRGLQVLILHPLCTAFWNQKIWNYFLLSHLSLTSLILESVWVPDSAYIISNECYPNSWGDILYWDKISCKKTPQGMFNSRWRLLFFSPNYFFYCCFIYRQNIFRTHISEPAAQRYGA